MLSLRTNNNKREIHLQCNNKDNLSKAQIYHWKLKIPLLNNYILKKILKITWPLKIRPQKCTSLIKTSGM